MNANIMNTQIFDFIKFDLKGHRRSHKDTFTFKIQSYQNYVWITLYRQKKFIR